MSDGSARRPAGRLLDGRTWDEFPGGDVMIRDSKSRLEAANQAISTAALLIRAEADTIEAFLKECRDMENFGSIVDPTLYRDPERRAVSATLEPIYEAAQRFLRAYDEHTAKARETLEKVSK